MEKEILISDDEYETRCAVLEEGVLNEIYIERKAATQTLGNLYKGRVENVLPGMQVAFVDIGLDRHAFLHISDLKYESANEDETEDENVNGNQKLDKDVDTLDLKAKPTKQSRGGRGFPFLISDLISKRQELLVQVGKEPIGTKGARVTSNITLPGRYAVYMPNSSNIGVSRRIESATERDRLRNMAKTIKADVEGGFIIRTAAEGLSEAEFETEIRSLINQWKQVSERAKRKSAPSLVSKDLSFTNRMVRDMLTKDVKQLLIDSKVGYRETMDYVSSVMPDLKSRVSLYKDDTTLFDAYGVERALKEALSEKIWLKCGGHIIIQQTEAMVSIDVNTGRFVGKSDPDNTILSANLEAVEEVVRQIQLRDLGGIIVVDFIDMEEASHRKRVFKMLQEALRKDRARTNILHFSDLGLVEMTRQRTRPSLSTLLMEECPYCDGHGTVLSIETVVIQLLRAIRMAHNQSGHSELRVIANDYVVSHIKSQMANKLRDLKKSLKLDLTLEADADLHLEDYRIFVGRGEELFLD
ncbi:Rne/Rng family ribonuclease [Candidatus Poribacteria bacterium]|nr:MAG: Rne/Rng family ribonuclease [Candidatus Poribacteria bacterium]